MTTIPTAAASANIAGVFGTHQVEQRRSQRWRRSPRAPASRMRSSLSASVGSCSAMRIESHPPASVDSVSGSPRRERDVLSGKSEVVKRVERAEARRHGVVGEEQQRPDHRQRAALVLGGGVDAAPVGIDSADLGVGPADREDQHAHRQDEPEAGSPGKEEGEAQHVKPAGAPVAEEQPAACFQPTFRGRSPARRLSAAGFGPLSVVCIRRVSRD